MERSDVRRIPLGVLYGLLGLLFIWSTAYTIPMTRDLGRVVFHPDTVVGAPFIADWPRGEIISLARGIERLTSPPLMIKDRVVSVDGHPFRAAWDVSRRVAAKGLNGTLQVVVTRKTPAGVEQPVTSTITLDSVANIEGSRAFRVLIAVEGLLMPWVCVLVGFWVAFVRPRDPLAWLVLGTLLGFQVGILQQQSYGRWPDILRIPGSMYSAVFGSTWAVWFPLFGVYFAGRLSWEEHRPWIKWVFVGPASFFAAMAIVVSLGETLDWRALVPVEEMARSMAVIAQLAGTSAVTFFFLIVGWKSGMSTTPDARRRLRLLLWGGCASLLPVLILVIAIRVSGRPIGTLPVVAVVSALILLPVFPLTLAYVILVDRAMDVRVAIRQGLRYTVTRGAIRFIAFLFLAGVGWNAWNLVNDPSANRPRKLKAMALGMAAVVVLPKFAKRAFAWTDRRFFREAYDVERVLTSLSEEVRTIAETGPLLDTVLDRIGTTLHVDRLAVFLQEGERLVPARSRGFDPAPSMDFDAASEEIALLRESGRPRRVRHDDPESPLRREQFSDEFRTRLSGLDAELILPLNGKKDLLGIVTLGPKKSEEPYSISDAALLGSVAAQTGLALENSRLTATIVAEIAKREWIGREIDIARGVQERLFPQRLPHLPGVDCAGTCRPAQGVGGDYYDFLKLSEGRLGIALGDVAGKGIPAALLMASLQASLRGQRLSGPADLAQLMTNLNFLIHEASPDNRYATFFYGELNPATGRLEYVNAGHNAPMLFRASGTVERLRATGPVIGLVEAGRFEQRSVVVAPGDLLLVYSDGISEAMNKADEEWGEERLAQAAAVAFPCAADALIDRLFAAADAFASGAVQHDDMTVVVVRMTA